MADARVIIENSQRQTYQAVNVVLVRLNGLFGKCIAEAEMRLEERADYGTKIIKRLSSALQTEYAKCFTKTNLYDFLSFYRLESCHSGRDYPHPEERKD